MRRLLPTIAIAAVALGVAAPSASAAATRAEYVAQVEPICLAAEQKAARHLKNTARRLKKAARRANKRLKKLEPAQPSEPVEIDKKLKKKIANALLGGLAGIFAKFIGPVVTSFDEATAQIQLVQPAPGDEAPISSWLAGRAEFARLSFIAVQAGHHGKFKRFAVFFLKAEDALRQGQAFVNTFGFNHCFIELPTAGTGPVPFARSLGSSLGSSRA